jgi:hypothetical protein
VPSPSRFTTRIFFLQLNPCGHSAYQSQSYFTTGGLPPISSSWRQAHGQRSFQLNSCSNSPYVTSSLTRNIVLMTAAPHYIAWVRTAQRTPPQQLPFLRACLLRLLPSSGCCMAASRLLPSNGSTCHNIYILIFSLHSLGLWDHLAVCMWVPLPKKNSWMPEPMFIKPDTYIMPPEAVPTPQAQIF